MKKRRSTLYRLPKPTRLADRQGPSPEATPSPQEPSTDLPWPPEPTVDMVVDANDEERTARD